MTDRLGRKSISERIQDARAKQQTVEGRRAKQQTVEGRRAKQRKLEALIGWITDGRVHTGARVEGQGKNFHNPSDPWKKK